MVVPLLSLTHMVYIRVLIKFHFRFVAGLGAQNEFSVVTKRRQRTVVLTIFVGFWLNLNIDRLSILVSLLPSLVVINLANIFIQRWIFCRYLYLLLPVLLLLYLPTELLIQLFVCSWFPHISLI